MERKPTRAQTRAQRRRALAVTRLGRAKTPAEQLAAAYGYARAVVLDLPPRTAEAVAAQLVDVLMAAGEADRNRSRRSR